MNKTFLKAITYVCYLMNRCRHHHHLKVTRPVLSEPNDDDSSDDPISDPTSSSNSQASRQAMKKRKYGGLGKEISSRTEPTVAGATG
jgi:hypothetical protein